MWTRTTTSCCNEITTTLVRIGSSSCASRWIKCNIWFGIDRHLAVDILYGTQLIDRIIYRIFPLKYKLVFWRSKPVTILPYSNLSHNTLTEINVLQDLTRNVGRNVQNETNFDVDQAAGQVLMQPNAQQNVLNPTKSHILFTILPRLLTISRQHMLAVRKIVAITRDSRFAASSVAFLIDHSACQSILSSHNLHLFQTFYTVSNSKIKTFLQYGRLT